MNRNKLSTTILCILLMFSIFSFIPVAFADPPDEWDPWQKGGRPAYLFKKPGYFPFTGGNWIGAWPFLWPGAHWPMDIYPGHPGIPHDEYSFIRIGWIISDYEIEMGWDPGPPYRFELFIDDEKIPMKRWARNVKDELVLFPDGEELIVDSHVWMFAARFDPYYFEPGMYEIRVVLLVKKPYFGSYGSDSNKWRPFVNYKTGGIPNPEPGEPDITFESWYGEAGLEWDQVHYLHVFDYS